MAHCTIHVTHQDHAWGGYIEKYILPDAQLECLIRRAEITDAICFKVGNSLASDEFWADAG